MLTKFGFGFLALSLLWNAAERSHQSRTVQLLADRDDVKADFLQLLVVENFAPVEDVSRLHHQLVNAVVIEFNELVPLGANDDRVRVNHGVVRIVEDLDGLLNIVGTVGDAR